MEDGISVIVCCYNSSKRLPETLKHLRDQETGTSLNWEIIIVDNGSTDDTLIVAQNELRSLKSKGVNLQFVKESRSGLSYAREKGFKSSRFKFVVLCDDDNSLANNYLTEAYNILSREPEVGILGGNNYYDGEVKNFITSNYINDYAIGNQSQETLKDVTDECGFVWGAGMVLRMNVIKDLEKKNCSSLLSDRTGKNLSSGGDTELCFAARLLGWKIAVSNLLKLKHAVPNSRFTLDYLLRLKEGFGKASPYLTLYEHAWLYQRQGVKLYQYKKELYETLRAILFHKKALFLYLIRQKKARKDFIELHFYLAKLKTILSKRAELDGHFINIINQFNGVS